MFILFFMKYDSETYISYFNKLTMIKNLRLEMTTILK